MLLRYHLLTVWFCVADLYKGGDLVMKMKHHVCQQCGVHLSSDEKAIYMKMVSRNATEFLCLNCLSEKLGCSRGALEERIRYYRESGNCVLFR